MKNSLRYLILVFGLAVFGLICISGSSDAAETREGILIGRITHVEGRLLRYIEEERDWVMTVKDSPFGLEDALYSEEDTRAEFVLPNRTWVRIDGNTQIQLIDLQADATTFDVGSGLVRVYNRSENTVVKVTTPFGYVVAAGDTVFDLYVGDESQEVIALRGKVDFVQERTGARYQVLSGTFSIIADAREITRGEGAVDAAWDDWNGDRDLVWSKRLRGESTYSARFLPEPLRDEAYVLDEAGRWERVYYEGGYHDMWRPLRVERDWRPFTAGHWVVYYGDNCWIPDEPFGYVTHHYGSWVYVETRRCWYWVPPVARVGAATPRFYLNFGWFPGRVGWIHSGTNIGWVPLAPYETYYCRHPWGYRAVVVDPMVSVNVGINISLASFLFIDHAVVISDDHFFGTTRYSPYIKRHFGRDTIINSYRPVTVINNTVINNYSSNFRRFAYSDTKIVRKPHRSIEMRIAENLGMKHEHIGKKRITRDMTRMTMSEPLARKKSPQLTISSKLVTPENRDKPLNSLVSDRKTIKGRERQVADSKVERQGGKVAKGKKTLHSSKEDKITRGEPTLQHEQKHGGKELKSHERKKGDVGRQELESGKKGKKEVIPQTVASSQKSPQKDRQEKLQHKGGPVKEQHQQQTSSHRQKGSGQQKWEEEAPAPQAQHGNKGGGKKNH